MHGIIPGTQAQGPGYTVANIYMYIPESGAYSSRKYSPIVQLSNIREKLTI